MFLSSFHVISPKSSRTKDVQDDALLVMWAVGKFTPGVTL